MTPDRCIVPRSSDVPKDNFFNVLAEISTTSTLIGVLIIGKFPKEGNNRHNTSFCFLVLTSDSYSKIYEYRFIYLLQWNRNSVNTKTWRNFELMYLT